MVVANVIRGGGMRSRLERVSFRWIEFTHSLIILSVFPRGRDTCLACCFTGSISARSPLTSEPPPRFFAPFHPSFPPFLFHYFSPLSLYLRRLSAGLCGNRERERERQELFALSSPRDLSRNVHDVFCIAIEQLINAPTFANCYCSNTFCPSTFSPVGTEIII